MQKTAEDLASARGTTLLNVVIYLLSVRVFSPKHATRQLFVLSCFEEFVNFTLFSR
jgi:hypothetical protein